MGNRKSDNGQKKEQIPEASAPEDEYLRLLNNYLSQIFPVSDADLGKINAFAADRMSNSCTGVW